MSAAQVIGAQDLDLEAYAALQHRVFAEVLAQTGTDPSFLTADHFGWKYAPPAGPAQVAVVRGDAGLVAVNAMFPMELLGPGGEQRIGWQSCDTATAPEGRGQGNFMRCLRALVAHLEPESLFLGFPNANSIRGFVKLGWAERGVVQTWARPVAPIGRTRGQDAGDPVALKLLGDSCFDAVRLLPDGWEVRRSTPYLRWRYGRPQYRVYADMRGGMAASLGVVRTVRSLGRTLSVVLELWGASRQEEQRMVRRLVADARREGTQGLVLLDSGRRAWDVSGFVPVPERMLPKRQVLMGGVKRDGAMVAQAFPHRWRVQTGDWDGF